MTIKPIEVIISQYYIAIKSIYTDQPIQLVPNEAERLWQDLMQACQEFRMRERDSEPLERLDIT